MKTSTKLFRLFKFSTTILTYAMTILFGLMSVGAFAQPCSSCGSCNDNPNPTANPHLQNVCDGIKVVLVLDESSSIHQAGQSAENAVKAAVLNFLGAVTCDDLEVAVMEF